MSMRSKLVTALKAHAKGEIALHLANVEVYLTSPVGIGEHSDIVGAITSELDAVARYEDQLEVIDKYLKL